MSGIDEDRHFRNSFRDFDPANPDPEILSRSGLSDQFLRTLRFHRNRLLKRHYQEYSRCKDDDQTVYTGKAGVAMLYLLVGKEAKKNNGLAPEVDVDDINKIDFEAKGLELLEDCLKGLKKRRVTFLCGDAGPLALAATTTDSPEHVQNLLKLLPEVVQVKGTDPPDELLYGRAGYLYALTFVRQKVENSISDSDVQKVIDAILESGKIGARREKHFPPLMYDWHDKHYLGAAHGLSGILFLLLRNRAFISKETLNECVKPTIEYIKSLKFPSGNFPSSLGSTHDKLIHWCHGAPGTVHLFLEASKAFPDKKDDYLRIAKLCGEVIWQRGLLKKGYGLCHGVAGNGYALLHLYQVTGVKKYLYRAAKFAEFCFNYGNHGCRIADRPLSLFEGLAGTVYFLSDLMDPARARFPAFYI